MYKISYLFITIGFLPILLFQTSCAKITKGKFNSRDDFITSYTIVELLI
jgi:hypothetical protein